MKMGFSSICCPTWDLRTMIEQAVLLGFDGFELRGLQGQLHLPLHPELSQNSEAVVQACESTNVELVCLGTSAFFGHQKKQDAADQKAAVREYIELAEKLHCPFVRVFSGDVPAGSNRYNTLGRIAEALTDLAHLASRHKVALLIENSGDLAGSRDLWFLIDSISHPALQACWNPINGLSVRERSTIAVPMLGVKIGMVHVADAVFDDFVLQSYQELGAGNLGVERLVELLCGVGFDGYLMLDWPKLWNDSLAAPEAFLPKAAEFLKAQLNVQRKPLSAYKGDKNAPSYAERLQRVPTRSE